MASSVAGAGQRKVAAVTAGGFWALVLAGLLLDRPNDVAFGWGLWAVAATVGVVASLVLLDGIEGARLPLVLLYLALAAGCGLQILLFLLKNVNGLWSVWSGLVNFPRCAIIEGLASPRCDIYRHGARMGYVGLVVPLLAAALASLTHLPLLSSERKAGSSAASP